MPPDRHHQHQHKHKHKHKPHHRHLHAGPLPSIAHNGATLSAGTVVQFTHTQGVQLGLISRITRQHGGATLHLQLASHSEVGSDLFLQHGVCATIPIENVIKVVPKKVRFVFDPAGVWRDPRSGCDACLSRAHTVFSPDGSFTHAGETYRVGDVVFLANSPLWDVGLLVDRPLRDLPARGAGAKVAVRLCGRYADLRGARSTFVSERRIYLTNKYEARPIADIVAKGSLAPGHPFSLSCTERISSSGRQPSVEDLRPLRERDLPPTPPADSALRLPSVDMYAGGGGSLLGASAHFDAVHAVDTDPACVATLRANRAYFPNLNIHACQVREFDLVGPPRGSVALLFAGPPCQGHSRANHSRHSSDARNDEITITLQTIARLRPAVAVVENVMGIKDATGGRNFALEIVARLLALGYQVRIGSLNAADFGSAQVRHRFFFLAARRGLPLPSWPVPTHGAAARITTLSLDGTQLLLQSHNLTSGAFPRLDAAGAVSDLPAWSYGVGVFDPARAEVGPNPANYAHRAQNDFQRRIRADCATLRDHVTGRRSARELLLIDSAPDARDETTVEGSCRRTHPHEPVLTLLTSSRPGGKGTAPIHWACHRTFTVAERKRFQGFPDGYALRGSVDDKDRMMGNAIHVAVAEALARQIKEDVFVPAWRARGRPPSDEFWAWWRNNHN